MFHLTTFCCCCSCSCLCIWAHAHYCSIHHYICYHLKKTGLSPLAPGQWKSFLTVYAGFWVFNNIVRPIRLAMAVAISPQIDKLVNHWQNRYNMSKARAITLTIILLNLVGTLSFMALGITSASALAGIPVIPR
jgi:hypothetical protein